MALDFVYLVDTIVDTASMEAKQGAVVAELFSLASGLVTVAARTQDVYLTAREAKDNLDAVRVWVELTERGDIDKDDTLVAWSEEYHYDGTVDVEFKVGAATYLEAAVVGANLVLKASSENTMTWGMFRRLSACQEVISRAYLERV